MVEKRYIVKSINPNGESKQVDTIEEIAEEIMNIIGKPEDDGIPDKRIPLREGWKDVWDY